MSKLQPENPDRSGAFKHNSLGFQFAVTEARLLQIHRDSTGLIRVQAGFRENIFLIRRRIIAKLVFRRERSWTLRFKRGKWWTAWGSNPRPVATTALPTTIKKR
ncbi:hypothetical protein LCGC14_3127820, partial [marine sediment metagenome]